MFFFLLCLAVAIIVATRHTPDIYGWTMLIGLGWLAGFLDCRLFARSDQDQDRVMPPDINEPSDDSVTF